jgi:hypothetical protein
LGQPARCSSRNDEPATRRGPGDVRVPGDRLCTRR